VESKDAYILAAYLGICGGYLHLNLLDVAEQKLQSTAAFSKLNVDVCR